MPDQEAEDVLRTLAPADVATLTTVSRGQVRIVSRTGLGPHGRRADNPDAFEWRWSNTAGRVPSDEQRALHRLADAGLITDEPGPGGVRPTNLGNLVVFAANRAHAGRPVNGPDLVDPATFDLGGLDPTSFEHDQVDRAAERLRQVTGAEPPGVTYSAEAVWVPADVLLRLLGGEPPDAWPDLRDAAYTLLARAGALLADWPKTNEHGTRRQRDAARMAYRLIHSARQTLDATRETDDG